MGCSRGQMELQPGPEGLQPGPDGVAAWTSRGAHTSLANAVDSRSSIRAPPTSSPDESSASVCLSRVCVCVSPRTSASAASA